MAEINPHIVELWSLVQRILAWFPITSGSLSSSIYATTAEIADLGPAESAGTSPTVTRGDHIHNLPYATASDIADLGPAESAGTAATVARGDHIHALPYATTAQIADVADTESAGTSATVARGDHVHDLGQIITTSHLTSGLYTTGTWSPAIAGTGTAGSNTYSNQDGFYVRFGGFVIAWFQVIMTAKDAAMAGNIYVTMPLTMASASVLGIGSVAGYQNINFAAGQTHLACLVIGGTTRCELYTGGDNAALANIVAADIAATSVIRGVAIYPI